ncbi:hypothetical protein EXIGLDRAFT_841188 [Exidia glandulosa HHB12029]|uniref:Rho GTPase activation protein n=1 Tax=Exidia glandulosa HHB12029 TaxID=1314781 RepID=A0A165E119_EXIGL|nr:hypothetical protein EXIGLDRAFT_841188 [Exidia glandulosa HHB12029]
MPAKRAVVPSSSSSPAVEVSAPSPPQHVWPQQQQQQQYSSPVNVPQYAQAHAVPPSPSGSLSRTPSPSSSISSFFKPQKWFQRTRTTSSSRGQSLQVPESSQQPSRPPPSSYGSNHSAGAVRKISKPTDPRPIISPSQTTPNASLLAGSKSVLDLSQTLNDPITPNYQPGGLGDLRAISKKKWSRSFDDLTRMISKTDPVDPPRTRTETAPLPSSSDRRIADQRAKIEAYRANSIPSPQSPSQFSFPSLSPSTASPPKGSLFPPPLSQSISAVNLRKPSASPNRPRSRSFQTLAPPALQINPAHQPPPPLPSSPASPSFHLSPKSSFPPQQSKERKLHHAGSFGFSLPSFAKNSPTGERPPDSPVVGSSHNHSSPDTPVDTRRMSQIVHLSGFLNRHPSITSAGAAPLSHNALAKGWKPFKVVVKGSKLLCYKPSSDRAAAIKELFPQGTVASIAEEEEGEDEEVKASPVEARAGRARRMFWGPTKHPELVLGEDGSIHRGTAEALVHECIFATTATGGAQDHRWRTFASAVLLCLPLIVGRDKFENDFKRYAERMLSETPAEQRVKNRGRIARLVRMYLQHHFLPSDSRARAGEVNAWRDWCSGKEVAVLDEAHPSLVSYLDDDIEDSKSVPTNGDSKTPPMFTNPFDGAQSVDSPNVNVFSPRPSDVSTMPSVTSSIIQPGSSANQSSSARTISVRPAVWTALATEGLSRDVFLDIPERAVVSSLHVYFRGALSTLLSGSSEEWVGDAPPVRSSEALLDASPTTPHLRDFTGSESAPHWLTLHIMSQILSPGGGFGGRSFGGRHSEDLNRIGRTRGELVSRWVLVGEQARAAGDECTWRAICAAVCSRPVARLEALWRRCMPGVRKIVQNWANALGESDERVARGSSTFLSGSKLPWVADLPEQARNILESAKTGGVAKGNEWEVEMLLNVERLCGQVVQRFMRGDTGAVSPIEEDRVQDGDMARLVQLWEHHAAQGRPGLTSMNHWMTLSISQEPRQRSRYAAHFWSSNGPLLAQSLMPLLFVEPLPTISFIDRAQLTRIKKDSLEAGAARPEFFERQIARTIQSGRTSDPKASTSSLGSLTVLPIFDGELTLLVQPGEVEQPLGLERKRSVNHSIRVSPGGNLERKSSSARRSSLPILSNSNRASLRSSESTDPPLRAVVRSGTLDRLIDLLVYGLEGVTVGHSDDNGEMPLREGGSRPLHVDRHEFARVWWYNFRSFVTPIVFFELLRKRYLSAMMPSQRTEVLQTVQEWIKSGGGALDALDNMDLWDGINTFLTAPSQRSGRASQLIDKLPADADAIEELEETRRLCLGTFIKLTLRPHGASRAPGPSIEKARRGQETPSFGPHPPSVDDISPEAFVDNLDAIATAVFKTLYPEVSHLSLFRLTAKQAQDFFSIADNIETQGCDRTGWFRASADQTTASDMIDIEDIYRHIQDLDISPLVSEMNTGRFERLLPPSMRQILHTHVRMVRWCIAQIASPHLGLQKREQRMEYFLRAIEICRVRSNRADSDSNVNPIQHPCARSFVETVLTSAILSPSSRTFHRAWQNVATVRNVGVDSLLSLTARSNVPHLLRPHNKLTTDIGWVIERMIEILSMADTIPSSTVAGSALINFDKRRSLSDLVSSTFTAFWQRPGSRTSHDNVDVDRLNAMFTESCSVDCNPQLLREPATREAIQQGTHPASRKVARPFQALVAAQQEKIKRDRHIRERLIREKRIEQLRTDKREEDLNRAMQARRTAGGGTPKHHKGKRSMSTLYKIMRPISTAFSNDNLFDGGRGTRRTPAELDFEPSGNPALVLSLVDSRVSAFVNNQRSFTFFLDTEDGGRFLFQAMSKIDMNKWMSAINKTAQSAGRKRLTYIGNSPKPQLADHLQVAAANPRDPVKVFGVELAFLLERETGSADFPPGTVPSIVSMLLAEIESRGLSEEGLYRIAGQKSVNDRIKELFNSGGTVDLKSDLFLDIYSLCDVVKAWFRELPGGLFPEESYLQVLPTMQHPDFESRIESARNLVHGLPRANFDLLRRVVEHLERVTDYEEQNHMTAENLAIVFGPNLIRAPSSNLTSALSSMGQATLLARLFIMNFHSIFDEPEPEADADGDGEIDEEDEDGDDVEGTGENEGLEDVEEDAAEDDFNSSAMLERPTPMSSPDHGDDSMRQRRRSYFPELPPLDLPRLNSLSAESILPPSHASS